MAIGSEPEVGTSFKSCRHYTMDDWDAWWKYMRENWGDYLQAGHSVLVHHKKDNPYYDKEYRHGRRAD
jgi:hypothetical protein